MKKDGPTTPSVYNIHAAIVVFLASSLRAFLAHRLATGPVAHATIPIALADDVK
jgi:hypothetical protein